jgi:hypothetical protein
MTLLFSLEVVSKSLLKAFKNKQRLCERIFAENGSVRLRDEYCIKQAALSWMWQESHLFLTILVFYLDEVLGRLEKLSQSCGNLNEA